MRRALPLVVCVFIAVIAPVCAQDFDIGETVNSSFSDIALLPTRLTSYNQHDDAATASYTCCKVRQEREIKDAIDANYAFLNRFADTAFADDTYMHYAYVSSFKPESFRNEEWGYRALVVLFPDSDLTDDAAWKLGNLYKKDYQHEQALEVFELMVEKWPESTWADDALMALVQEYTHIEDEAAALDALNQLAYDYPKSNFCPVALNTLAAKYMEFEDYQSAINASQDLIDDFPYNDLADDCQWRIGQCFRLMGDLDGALEAYDYLIENWYGSNLTNRAMREANDLIRRIRGGTQRTGQMYDPLAWNPAKDAKELWHGEAKHYQNNGYHAMAVAKFREFIDTFPGNDLYDDAWYEIGQTYVRQDFLFQEINAANGPDDINRLAEDYAVSTGDEGPVPTHGELSALGDATEAFAHIANNLIGSTLRTKALGMVARSFTPYGEIDVGEVTADAAYTHQEIVIHFPFCSCRLPFFADGAVPVFALCKLMKFYAKPANWEIAREMYPDLANEYPAVFPVGLEQDKANFHELMKLYNAKIQHAYDEMNHHIKYGLAPSDLLPEAYYYQSAMLMGQGDYQRASDLLERLCALKGHDLVAPGHYLYAQANVRLGNWETARQAFTALSEQFKNTGLGDDAHISWTQYQDMAANPQKYDLTSAVQKAYAKFETNPANMDVFIGEHCIVFAPFTRAALMRQYNMPNIWDEAQRVLSDWTGTEETEKIVIVVDRACKSSAYGNPFKVAGCQIKDPPNWGLGLTQIAENALAQSIPHLTEDKGLLGGIAHFVASSLQYDLVTETRDTIGSASAVKLPQEEVIKARERALQSLDEYIIAGEDGTLSRNVISGMMHSLLASNGFTRDRLIDREPFRAFFAELKELPEETNTGEAFAIAATSAFGDGATEQLAKWGLPLPQTAKVDGDLKVGMLP